MKVWRINYRAIDRAMTKGITMQVAHPPANTLFETLLGEHIAVDAHFLLTPDGAVLGYGALRDQVLAVAADLIKRGVAPGDRVLVQVGKQPSALTLYLGTIAAGAVFVPLNTAYTGAEIAYFLKDAAPRLLVLDAGTTAAADVARAEGVDTVFLDAIAPEKNAAAGFAPVPRGPDDLAAILYTSGTTGRSKGAMLTHDNLLSNARALADLWQWRSDDVLLHALPIFHTHGLFVATNTTLISGAAMYFLPGFDLDQIHEALPEVTTMMGVPTFYTRMLVDPRFNTSTMGHLRLIISGSAPLLTETHRAFEAQTGHAILERYGMTETNMITSNPYVGDRRPGSVGHPLPGVSLRISDPDQQGIGGIEVKGPNVTPGYWQNPEKTAESFTADGFFITGDLGQIGPDGYLSIVGRAKDLVISGGYNIYPKEVEVEIDALPGVLESAVFGVPDADLGEAVAAAVVLTPGTEVGADDIMRALKDRLARYKQPRQILFLPALPRNAMGKVQKNDLRVQATSRST